MKLSIITLLLIAAGSAYSLEPNVKFYLALRPQKVQELEDYVLTHLSNISSYLYGEYLTRDQLHYFIKPTATDREQVDSWLNNWNIPRSDIEDLSDTLIVNAPRSKVEDMFQIPLYRTAKGEYRAGSMPEIPQLLAGAVEMIGGLYNPLTVQRPRTAKNLNTGQGNAYITREVISDFYNFPLNMTVNPELVSTCPMEFLGECGFSPKDLVQSEIENGLRNNTPAHVYGNHRQVDIESELDIQMIATVAANTNLTYWDVSGWMYEMGTEMQRYSEIPQVLSLSWGWSELQQCINGLGPCNGSSSYVYVKRCNWEFLKLCARGTTIVVSAGDAGSPGRTEEGCTPDAVTAEDPIYPRHMNPIFPGSSPWVLSVGATYLVNATTTGKQFKTPVCANRTLHCAAGGVEQGVTFDAVSWTSGSGFDHWNTRPIWQYDAVQGYLNSSVPLPQPWYWNSMGRAYPDVAAFGHNCAVVAAGRWIPVDGTSCSCPIWAGIVTLLNNYQLTNDRPRLGFVNPLLYQMYSQQPNTFQDVTVGNSSCTEMGCCGPEYGFLATTGWDPVAGLGSPNVLEMMSYLDKFTYYAKA